MDVEKLQPLVDVFDHVRETILGTYTFQDTCTFQDMVQIQPSS